VKLDRILVLRAASDYTVGPPGVSAVELMLSEAKTGPVGTHQALENLYRTASPVVRYLTEHWAEMRDKVPGK
jgi:purine nucleoside permease